MYSNDHGAPHFHAVYAGKAAKYAVSSLIAIKGRLPRRIDRLIREWANEHQEELLLNWQLMRANQPPRPIEPLK